MRGCGRRFFCFVQQGQGIGNDRVRFSGRFPQCGRRSDGGLFGLQHREFLDNGKPTGWSDPVIDAANRTITVVSPEKFDDDNDAVKSGSVTLTGKVHGGSTASATLFVGVVDTEDLSDKPANCYLINKKETNYLINAMYKGDVTEQVPSSVDVVWQSRSNLIQYLELKDGKASFYVAADSDDGDKIKEGNAVIGAYDAGGTLIWSWHVWAADYDPEAEGGAVDFNGYSMMTRNLGALAADNSSVENILASYGLYYQWGRKDPSSARVRTTPPTAHRPACTTAAAAASTCGRPLRAPRRVRWLTPCSTR